MITDWIKEKDDKPKEVIDIDKKRGLNILYIPQFYSAKKAKKIFKKLEKKIEYNTDEESKVVIFGKEFQIPRKQVGFGEPGTTYSFAGNTVKAKPWPKFLLKIKEDVEKATGLKFNFCLLNRYKDGEDLIHYHADDEDDLGDEIHVAGVSFGTERDFLLKNNADKDVIKYNLGVGSLIVMKHPTNSYWKHSIPKRTGVKTPRVSLTFRLIVL